MSRPTIADVIAELRATPDPAPHTKNALVDLWGREYEGMAKGAILSVAVHDMELAAVAAGHALARGCRPSVIADVLEEADRRFGSGYEFKVETPDRSNER